MKVPNMKPGTLSSKEPSGLQMPKSLPAKKKMPNFNVAKEAKPKIQNPSFIGGNKQFYGPPFGYKNK